MPDDYHSRPAPFTIGSQHRVGTFFQAPWRVNCAPCASTRTADGHTARSENKMEARLNEQTSQLPPGKTVILIAEDEAVIRNLVQLMLLQEGYAVLSDARR